MDKGFFQPTSWTIDFSLRLKNSDQNDNTFVALRFQKYRPRGAIRLFFPPPRKKKNSDKAFNGLPIIAFRAFLFGESNRKWHHEISIFETAEPQKMSSRDQNFLTTD